MARPKWKPVLKLFLSFLTPANVKKLAFGGDTFNPFQNHCSNTGTLALTFNQHLAADASGYARLVDVFDASMLIFLLSNANKDNICLKCHGRK